MNNSVRNASKSVSPADVRDRGGELAIRLRVAGFPQYTRWFSDHNPKWKGDEETARRIRRLLNERGSAKDVELLKDCEALADRYLPKNAKAA
jgi:hypothetical protein